MDLFHEHGYDRVTVEEIAARAGLTERTFFRYFTDKREVLFAGSEVLTQIILDAVRAAPPEIAPLDAAVAALEATGTMFEERRSLARKRSALILAHPELQERELIKLATLASSIADGMHTRAVPRPTARLIGETAMAIFRSAFERWVADTKAKHDFAQHVRATYADLRALSRRGQVAAVARAASSGEAKMRRWRTIPNVSPFSIAMRPVS